MTFFQPPDELRLELYELQDAPGWLYNDYPEDAHASCHISHQSLRCHILYDASQAESGADLWATIGHEVAHLLMLETIRLSDSLKGKDADNATYALEVTTVRLERLFERQCIYPGDDAFKETHETA